jgi:hypothetical protein
LVMLRLLGERNKGKKTAEEKHYRGKAHVACLNPVHLLGGLHLTGQCVQY